MVKIIVHLHSPCGSAGLREAESCQQIIAYAMFLLIYVVCKRKGIGIVKMASSPPRPFQYLFIHLQVDKTI